ncbi:DUF1330 domain-containing protein [Alphaproteobacteria bacterium]|jgi:uncharacterized protein (DUF1330 family)|nr:DUF1330 domain-containing protein [Alphaproteobacteria bacterium]
MTKVYMIANLTVENKEGYLNYEKGFFPILKKYQGEFITFDDGPRHFEGSGQVQGRVIMFSFPSAELAEQWFNDPDYQALADIRRENAPLTSLTMVKGLPPRP